MPAEIKPWMRELMNGIGDRYFGDGADNQECRDAAAIELAEAFAEHEREQGELRQAAENVLFKSYTDDDVLHRHSVTTVECMALLQLKATLASGGGKC